MKFNVDLTENHDFRPNNWTIKYVHNGVEIEDINYNNPNARQYKSDFFEGKIIFFTGNASLRKAVISRKLSCEEDCEECGKKIRIPWKGCSCYPDYLAKYHKIPWRDNFALRYGRSIPWRNNFYNIVRRIPWNPN